MNSKHLPFLGKDFFLHNFRDDKKAIASAMTLISSGGVERIRTSAPVTQPNDLANRPLQPLEYHSVYMAGAVRIELTTYGFGDRCSTN